MEFTLDRPRATQYPTDSIIAELRRVAAAYKNRRFSRREFDQVATYCKGTVVLVRFGSWQAALDATGITFHTAQKDKSRISNEDLFAEMSRIWRANGHRPSKDEWEHQQPRFSYTTYKTRFHGWVNACAAFIEFISAQPTASPTSTGTALPPSSLPVPAKLEPSDRRGVPMKLRYQVLTRDNFKCADCGRSPVTHIGVALHIDHIRAFSQGGKTVLGNLRTLCHECNWGKGVGSESAV
jgi:hypothetical protein